METIAHLHGFGNTAPVDALPSLGAVFGGDEAEPRSPGQTAKLLEALGIAPAPTPEPTTDQLRHEAGMQIAAEWSGPGPDRDILLRIATLAADPYATRDQLAELRARARGPVMRAIARAYRRGVLPALGAAIRARRGVAVRPVHAAHGRAPRRQHPTGAASTTRAGPADSDDPPPRAGQKADFSAVGALLVSDATSFAMLGLTPRQFRAAIRKLGVQSSKVGRRTLARADALLAALGLAEPARSATEVKAAENPRARILRAIGGDR